MSFQLKTYFEPESGTWCYLGADTDSGDAFVLDPVWVYDPVSGKADRGFIDQLLNDARASGWAIRWILETHAHADHLSGAGLIRSQTGASTVIGHGIRSVQTTFAQVYQLDHFATDGSQFDRLVKEGDELPLGKLSIKVMETPGHTSDSVTYLVAGHAFIGDTLFSPEYGSARCDFPGGDAGSLFDSVQRLYGLAPETLLHLCHDYPEGDEPPRHQFSVEHMHAHNTHISADTQRETFVALRKQRDAGLNLPRLILPAVQVNILAGQAPDPETNGVSYLKIPFNTDIKTLTKPLAGTVNE